MTHYSVILFMSFLTLIFKNPFRNKARALLAIVGIGIGIACIVALGAVSDGLSASVDETLHTGGSDFIVSGKTSDSGQASAFGTENINESWVNTIQSQSGVNQAVGVYIGVVPMNKSYFALMGLDPKDYSYADINISSGSMYKNNANELILGKVAASNLNKSVGDSIDLANETYKVVGIYETGDQNKDSGGFTSLISSQNLMDAESNISMIYVKVDKGADVDKITNSIDSKYNDSISTITSINDLDQVKTSMDTINSATWGISLLAIIIGGIGVINTMVMTVHERTKELGLLKAIGWSKKRILFMILGESIVTTLVAGIIGSILGIIGAELLVSTNMFSGLSPVFAMDTFVQAFVVAIVVGIIGGLYPAIKAVKLPPTEALGFD